jgi:hypothetical protein
MKRVHIVIAMLLAFATLTATAQKRKATVRKKAAPTAVQKEPEDPRLTQMLAATQRIMFVDSVVVSKKSFLNAIHLNPETGKLARTTDFLGKKGDQQGTAYQNELGNKLYFSTAGKLYTSDLMDGEWAKPAPMEGIDTFGEDNYPFMMTDGTTFFFASTDGEGLGGYDIYMTRFDSESGKYLKPENIGMPFNSEANDYMYAIDEMDSIGYFASDRRQPEGMVCIYTFIPNPVRRTYDPDELDTDKLKSLARIDRIKDTWGDGRQRQAAMARIKRLTAARKAKKADEILFPIDDNTCYTRLADFRLPDNRQRFAELQDKKKRLATLATNLEKSRQEYAKASAAERDLMEAELMRNENEYYELEQVIRQIEKNIRNTELQLMQ